MPALQRRGLEGAYGVDLAGVRLHRLPIIVPAAVALTRGDDIYLSADAPPLGEHPGHRLLAHEVAHVVQQRNLGVREAIGSVGDPYERAADAAAGRAVAGGPMPQQPMAPVVGAGPVPAVQCQERTAPTVTATQSGVNRSEAQAALLAFLTKILADQGGVALRMTDALRQELRAVAAFDLASSLAVDAYLAGGALPGTPAELAAQIALRLREPVNAGAVARLRRLSGGAGSEPRPAGAVGRVTELVRNSAPGAPDQSSPYARTPPPRGPTATERMDQFVEDQRARSGAPAESRFGPYAFDVLRAVRIASGLPQAISGPSRTAAADPAPPNLSREVEAAAAALPAGGTPDLQEIGREIARRLSDAEPRGFDSIVFDLGAGYAAGSADSREALLAQVRNVARTVAAAFPGGGLQSVRTLVIVLGGAPVRYVPLPRSGGSGPAR